MKEIRLTFNKGEKLKSAKTIATLFAEGESALFYPLKIVWKFTSSEVRFPAQAAFAVSSKIFRKSTVRNLLKRRIREAYRQHKELLYEGSGEKKTALMFIYIAREELDYARIEKSVVAGLKKIIRSRG